MRIAVVDLVSLDGGGYQITRSLFQYAASGASKSNDWLFIVSKQNFESNRFVRVINFPKGSEGYFNRVVTEATKATKCLQEYGADVVISMPNIPVIGCKQNQIVYLQQSIPFQREKRFSFLKKEERGYAFRQYVQGGIIKKEIKKAKAVLVQTEWMRKAVQETSGAVPVFNIGYPMKDRSSKTDRESKTACTDFFYPCGPAIYKNVTVIVKAVKLLIEKGYEFTFYLTLTRDEVKSLIDEELPDTSELQFLGRISPEAVEKMYSQTTLVFASYIETLGLPLIEARDAGAWIIASDCAFSHEILNDYPNRDFFNPFDEMDLAKKMEMILIGNKTLDNYSFDQETESCWDKMVAAIQK